jgi:hypothetical protein
LLFADAFDIIRCLGIRGDLCFFAGWLCGGEEPEFREVSAFVVGLVY